MAVCLGEEGEVPRGQRWNLDARAPSQGRRARTGKWAGDLPVLLCLGREVSRLSHPV